MIYMNQNKLSRTCTTINNASSIYSSCIQYGTNDVVDWFNDYWISKKSKEVADSLYQQLNCFSGEIKKIFDDLNSKIKKEVRNYNQQPDVLKKIYYKGFSVTKPYIKKLIYLNNYLRDGKVGSLPKETNMSYPFVKLKIIVGEASSKLKTAIAKCDAISSSEQKSIQDSITIQEKRCLNEIENIENETLKNY